MSSLGFAFDSYDDEKEKEGNSSKRKYRILPKGIYDFEIESSLPTISRAGNKSLKLVLKIWDKEGFDVKVWDYLTHSDAGLSRKKIKDFCYAVGLHDEYEKKNIPFELSGLNGKVEIDIQPEKHDNQGNHYPEKNIVKNYIRQETPNNNMIDEDIPF